MTQEECKDGPDILKMAGGHGELCGAIAWYLTDLSDDDLVHIYEFICSRSPFAGLPGALSFDHHQASEEPVERTLLQ